MTKREPIAERFARDIATHQMDVRHEDGLYRHVVFKRPDTVCMMFSLTTTPGRLVYAGDMGCFVFERLPDMFKFFRTDRAPNMGYWHEKLVATDRDGSTEKSSELFRENLKAYEADELTDEQQDELADFIETAVSTYDDESPQVAYKMVHEFRLDDGNEFFYDFFERNDRQFTIRFEWACYAISWGIQQYDLAKAASCSEAVAPFEL
jgi:hypothetical protein